MLRIAVILLVVFSLPFIVWTLWRMVKGTPDAPAPTPILVGAGFACSVAALLAMAVLEIGQGDGDGVYIPPSLQDGQIRPGSFQEREREPSNDPSR
ncbi:hypothetical protein ACWCOP_04785 [Maricaulaceae bacterium MS644]